MLHFILYRSNNGREAYTEILNEQFQKLLHKKYSKEKSACLSLSESGYPLLYEDILKAGSPKNAIRNAEKQLDYLEKQYNMVKNYCFISLQKLCQLLQFISS